jgi:transposase-like protein
MTQECLQLSWRFSHFPSDEAATKLLFLALRNIEKDWKLPQRTWKQAANQFAIMFGERFTNAIT